MERTNAQLDARIDRIAKATTNSLLCLDQHCDALSKRIDRLTADKSADAGDAIPALTAPLADYTGRALSLIKDRLLAIDARLDRHTESIGKLGGLGKTLCALGAELSEQVEAVAAAAGDGTIDS